jgi:hypothetical protein
LLKWGVGWLARRDELVRTSPGPGIDVDSWRAEQARAAAPPSTGSVDETSRRIADLRARRQLAEARQLALTLAALHPAHPDVSSAASRAESDAVFLFPEDDKRSRNHAAASALDYALAAQRNGASSAADLAQLAWALGTSTHLQPMFDRSSHARRTLETAEQALLLDPGEPTALATLALVNLRLETLPWIAKLMASGRPDSSLEAAERFATRAATIQPSRENRQILAKVLIARDERDRARAELDAALAAPATWPRDAVLESALRELRKTLDS